MNTNNSSIRNHPDLKQLFIDAESRHLDNSELKHYCSVVPEYINRAKAAHEIKKVQTNVVNITVKEIFMMYPYLQHHDLSQGKCQRDVRYVSAYITQAMLMNDPQWLNDKLLLWLKTILQAFCFPERNKEIASVESYKNITQDADKMPAVRSSIYETYKRLKSHYSDQLSPESYALIEPLLETTCKILAAE